MITTATTLRDALRQHGLSSREDKSGSMPGRVLTQKGRDVGRMDAQTGWCLVRLLSDETSDTYPRYIVTAARALMAGVDRPSPPGIPCMDITDRGQFDAAVLKRFPNARRHRKEHPNGFEDTLILGFLHISLRVYTDPYPRLPKDTDRYPPGTLVVSVSGVRTAVDNSVTKHLWRAVGKPGETAIAVLDQARQEILGISHALAHICGRGAGQKKQIIGELSELWASNPDVRKIFGD